MKTTGWFLAVILTVGSYCSGRGELTVEELRMQDRLESLAKNAPGTPAADFDFTTPDGRVSSLYDELPSGGGNLLLIFFDPSCESCDETLDKLARDKSLSDKVEFGSLKVLAVYSGDNEVGWRRKAENLPPSWTVGYDPGEIDDDELYYLPSYPSFLLIGGDGTVISKDFPYPSFDM